VAEAEAARLHAAMMEIINSKLLSRCVSLAAEFAIADHLRNGAESVASLASKTGTNVDALYRVMRLLAASGIFVERPGRRFENNPSSEILRSDASGSLRHYARWIGSDFHWKMVTGLDYSVKTGKPALQKDEPEKDAFEILAEDRIAHQTFNYAMSGLSEPDGAGLKLNRIIVTSTPLRLLEAVMAQLYDAHCEPVHSRQVSSGHGVGPTSAVFGVRIEPPLQAHFTHSIKMIGGCSIKSDQYWRSTSPVISGESSGSCQVTCLNPEALNARSWVSILR